MNTITLGEIIVVFNGKKELLLDGLLLKIKLAIQKNKHTHEVLNHANYKIQIRKKDAIYIVKTEMNEFISVYLKKGIFG
ncbi:hypothetical protein [Cohnella sp. WQ 127256]|uniref:hypothetical protein n=1 Tax=Cohnella sp. WQ 127256 TaxID=2938790 RepID=UPI002118D70A|nr:hypothetical protein [Cohnella sp. WQ 127256]